MMKKVFSFVVGIVCMAILPVMAGASQPTPWQLGFQESASPVMDRILDLHDILMIVVVGITVLVLSLIIFACIRFRQKPGVSPSKNAHNTPLEIFWTVIPAIILILVFIPTFKLINYSYKTPGDTDLTIKIIGHQWYWSYEYPDNGNFGFDSYMKKDDELAPGEPRLLATDNDVVIPVNTNVRLLITADDVIHAWAIPAFGVKKDAIPGRTNETWVNVKREGIYYGQCSELCGVLHGFMPISVRVVSKRDFRRWVRFAKRKFASDHEGGHEGGYENVHKGVITLSSN